MANEASVYMKEISFDGRQYQVRLPWKENHTPLPDNYDLSHRPLLSLLKWLRRDPRLLTEYNSVIKDKLDRGIVKPVGNALHKDGDLVHYLPQQAVVS